MDTTKLKKFAQFARRALIEQVDAKLEAVRAEGSAAQREHPAAFKKLEASIAQHGEDEVIERVAYIWFNRFTALRFLDVNELNAVRVVSPLPGQFQPEILADAKAGNINEQLVPEATRRKVRELLEGMTPSQDPQAEAYRLLLVAICNSWQTTMPFLFERIDDYTELLLPTDLLSNASILAYLREAMTPDACQDVEIIGWLYQFYISEKKDQVFAGLKKNKKIEAENIPAATQLFTPHWIVRYLVENSLGRLWLLNRPGSKLAERMGYYIAPEEPETDFLKIGKPEEIKICDPACGSGHMLTYAFDLLYAIYEEEGYDPAQIPALILQHNLTGVEIDDRAGALAAFALAMKAAAKLGRRRFLRMEAKPDICVLQDASFTSAELRDVAAVVGKDLFSDELRETLGQFEQAKNFGSLIIPKLRDPAETLRVVEARDFDADLLLRPVLERLVKVLQMAEALSPKYHVVVANPPYAGAKGLNSTLGSWVKENFPRSKSDLMTCFMERSSRLTVSSGFWGMINLPSWMFLGSFQLCRAWLLEEHKIDTLLQLGRGIFGSDFGSVAFTVQKRIANSSDTGIYRRLFEQHVQVRKPDEIETLFQDRNFGSFKFLQKDFEKIPGYPIAFSLSKSVIEDFANMPSLAEHVELKAGLLTGDNVRFQREWFEVSLENSDYECTSSGESGARWFPCHSGGDFRKWYGNHEVVVNWENDGQEIRNFKDSAGKLRSRPQNIQYFFREGITYSKISAGKFDTRYRPPGFVFDDTGRSGFSSSAETERSALAFLCSNVADSLLAVLCPTLSFNTAELNSLPFDAEVINRSPIAVEELINLGKSDWDAYETSWDFTTLPLLSPDHRAATLAASYSLLRAHWQGMTDEMQRLEEENNHIFIDAYGLQDELKPEVPIEEITLNCNPAYSIRTGKTDEDREVALRARTMQAFLSYAVGCMFGRYSLDAPGLILANQGETLADYLARVREPSFLPDEDNVIPVLSEEFENWFPDDIADRFRKFLRVTFGEAHFRDNLAFVEAQIGDIRKYFTKGFYEDHVKRYKKRPIYWMFSSPKGTFQALIYMHRYRPDTVSVLRNEYLVEFIRKLEAERAKLAKLADDPSATQAQRTKAEKAASTIVKQIAELEEWEREVIFPLAQEKKEIDLDEGVKQNYPLFAGALKPIKGLEAKNE
ncbi:MULTISPECIES: BREX-1 system adenine-specific DNA-methyltransferase PglX [Marinovum]|uniref:BREX-1 system adenine-specific DNA-methyltransferase PglX n=1 Tax=Marinovum TaxID=367771 RepID=UPI00237B2472|nr:BREX-1 system adenine-specific DNA-methyltransferase PglX [Marinovum sp. PR37]MDD9746826.1 BREX-1 system adenine-specific DNA-methyltransferase PglX [Marinovum sp. PR37]